MIKKIALASIITAVIGIIIELFLSSNGDSIYWGYLTTLNLAKLGIGVYGYSNYMNVFFYLLLLLGGVLYFLNKNGNRLIRYVFSIIFFSKSFFIFFKILSIILFYKYITIGVGFVLSLLSVLIGVVAWMFLSYKILKYFEKTITLKTITQENYLGENIDIIALAKWPKRLFNRLIDLFVMVLLFLPFSRWIIHTEFVIKLGHVVENEFLSRVIVYLFVCILQLIYYFTFESVFQATPGKLLSGTRVVTEEGGKPGTKQIFIRSVTRLVPFEAFSIFGQMWHDTWSDTYVVNEARQVTKDIDNTNTEQDIKINEAR